MLHFLGGSISSYTSQWFRMFSEKGIFGFVLTDPGIRKENPVALHDNCRRTESWLSIEPFYFHWYKGEDCVELLEEDHADSVVLNRICV